MTPFVFLVPLACRGSGPRTCPASNGSKSGTAGLELVWRTTRVWRCSSEPHMCSLLVSEDLEEPHEHGFTMLDTFLDRVDSDEEHLECSTWRKRIFQGHVPHRNNPFLPELTGNGDPSGASMSPGNPTSLLENSLTCRVCNVKMTKELQHQHRWLWGVVVASSFPS